MTRTLYVRIKNDDPESKRGQRRQIAKRSRTVEDMDSEWDEIVSEVIDEDRDLLDRLADAGEDASPRESVLSVEDIETLGRIFRPTNLELLQAIVDHEPESIPALAQAVGRDLPDIREGIAELTNYGLVELEEHGQAKQPALWYDEIDIKIPLGEPSGGVRDSLQAVRDEIGDALEGKSREELREEALERAKQEAEDDLGPPEK